MDNFSDMLTLEGCARRRNKTMLNLGFLLTNLGCNQLCGRSDAKLTNSNCHTKFPYHSPNQQIGRRRSVCVVHKCSKAHAQDSMGQLIHSSTNFKMLGRSSAFVWCILKSEHHDQLKFILKKSNKIIFRIRKCGQKANSCRCKNCFYQTKLDFRLVSQEHLGHQSYGFFSFIKSMFVLAML